MLEPENLSYEQLAGQRLMVGFDGTQLNDELMFLIDTLKIGGIILFSRNISTPYQVESLCASVQDYALSWGQPPLLIAVDQEGGQVSRLKAPFTQFPGNSYMKSKEDAERFGRITALELKKVGINMNLAPVMDIANKDIDSVMKQRSFGDDPAWVSELGSIVIEQLQKNGVLAVAKHFPGIGRTVADSHYEMPSLDIYPDELESFELKPFYAAIRSGVTGIMLSHILYRRIDQDWPASLSIRIAKDILRNQMEFNGIIMTDDLDMCAISNNFNIQTSVRQILFSEIDIILICHKGPNIAATFEEILKNMKSTEGIRASGIKSVRRIMQAKQKVVKRSDILV